jgi:hypothetical protein
LSSLLLLLLLLQLLLLLLLPPPPLLLLPPLLPFWFSRWLCVCCRRCVVIAVPVCWECLAATRQQRFFFCVFF